MNMTAIATKNGQAVRTKGKERIELYNDVFTLIWGRLFRGRLVYWRRYGVVLSADARTRDFVRDNKGKASRALFFSVISVLFSLCPQLLAL